MGYIKDNYQTTNQFFKDVKNGINDIGLRLDDLEGRREDVTGGGGLTQEEDGKEYKAGEGILITDDDSIALNYDGPFAYHLDHIDTTTTTTLWVTRSVGYVVRNGLRKTVYANTTPASMASGESAWMLYNTDADSYSISIQTNAPTATSNKICVKLAENVNGVLRQIQFGEVVVVATSGAVLGLPDFTNGTTTDTSSHQVTGGDIWLGVDAIINYNNSGNGGWVQLIISESAYGTALYTPTVVQYEGSDIAVSGSILVPVKNGLFHRIQTSGSVTVIATIYPSI